MIGSVNCPGGNITSVGDPCPSINQCLNTEMGYLQVFCGDGTCTPITQFTEEASIYSSEYFCKGIPRCKK